MPDLNDRLGLVMPDRNDRPGLVMPDSIRHP
jgi:hypothetical protein